MRVAREERGTEVEVDGGAPGAAVHALLAGGRDAPASVVVKHVFATGGEIRRGPTPSSPGSWWRTASWRRRSPKRE
ncbi:MAG TPA: hypothetical protein VGV85_01945 [Longimicrobiaceae bacterium]|nr:hypothetical protein [Longimicrobiaceae bacterium]